MGKQPTSKNEYEVEAILSSRIRTNGQKLYLIKWKNYTQEYNTWQPIQHLIAVEELVREYQVRQFQKAVEDVRKKDYKSEKIRRRFEAMRISSLEKIMIHRMKISQKVKLLKENRKNNILTSKKTRRNVLKNRKKTHLSKTNKPRKKKISKIKQEQTTKKPKQIAVCDQTYDIQSQVKISQIKQNQCSTNLGNIKQVAKEENKQISSFQNENSDQSEEIDEEEQSPSQDIETILKKEQKVGKSQLVFVNNQLMFDIPYKKQGTVKQFRISKQQIFKVNPGWLNTFFGGFYF